ncbi:MAG: methylmalonyl-CoA mutase family protein [Candidatus Bathyarchaeia archaeon]
MTSAKEIRTDSGIPVDTCYKGSPATSESTTGSKPGEYPFTRGIYPTMYRERVWTMRQYSGFGSAEETNERFRYLLQQGQTGLSVAFDLPTQLGLDADSPRASGEVGKVGVPINTIEDMRTLLNDIPLDKVSTSMTINSTAPTLMAAYVAVAEERGIPPEALRGTTQNDILKEYVARNTYIYPPRASLRLSADLIDYCAKQVPKWYPISISGYHIREAGANAVQELAFTFANAIEYVKTCLSRGMTVDSFAPRLSFFFACQNDFFEEVAKFRAARRIWAEIMKETFNAQTRESWMLRFHTQTSGESLTAKQPQNNIVRVTLQALAAVLGGTQSLHTNSYDEALCLPTADAVKIALRTQQILAHESGVVKAVDPLGGSYYVEYLTDEIKKRVNQEITKIDAMGGALAAIESGYMRDEIRRSAYDAKLRQDSGDRTVVGINKFADKETLNFTIHRVDPKAEARQLEKLQKFKSSRDKQSLDRALQTLKYDAATSANLMPSILGAVKAGATNGEISNVLREVYGEYKPKLSL